MLGPNAAGKTTHQMITGFDQPTPVRTRSVVLTSKRSLLRRGSGWLMMRIFPSYDKLTAWEFFRFTGEVFRIDARASKKNAAELVERFHLRNSPTAPSKVSLTHAPAHRHRLALLHDPEVFIVDEPMVGLDPQHARVVKRRVKERALSRRDGAGVNPPAQHCRRDGGPHRASFMGGRLIAVGTREELRRKAAPRPPWRRFSFADLGGQAVTSGFVFTFPIQRDWIIQPARVSFGKGFFCFVGFCRFVQAGISASFFSLLFIRNEDISHDGGERHLLGSPRF